MSGSAIWKGSQNPQIYPILLVEPLHGSEHCEATSEKNFYSNWWIVHVMERLYRTSVTLSMSFQFEVVRISSPKTFNVFKIFDENPASVHRFPVWRDKINWSSALIYCWWMMGNLSLCAHYKLQTHAIWSEQCKRRRWGMTIAIEFAVIASISVLRNQNTIDVKISKFWRRSSNSADWRQQIIVVYSLESPRVCTDRCYNSCTDLHTTSLTCSNFVIRNTPIVEFHQRSGFCLEGAEHGNSETVIVYWDRSEDCMKKWRTI